MKKHPYDNPLTAGLRLFLTLLFWFVIWRNWGWGWSLIAVLLILATGVRGDKQIVFADVPGPVRLLLELVFALFGLWAVFAHYGTFFGIVALLLFLFFLLLSVKRIRFLFTGRM